jgi:hypothetical protein
MTPRVLLGPTLILATLVALENPAATAQTPQPRPIAALVGPAGVAAMVDLEMKMNDSLQVGHAVPVVYDSAARLPGHVVSAPYWGDTALWTGVYLGGQAMRYQVATHHLGGGGDQQPEGDHQGGGGEGGGDQQDGEAGAARNRAFWTAQRDQALARVRSILLAEHRDITIAQDWSGQTKVPPAVNTQDPTGPHTADFGGGAVRGEPGMVTRGCTPVGLGPMGIHPPDSNPANPVNDHSNHVYEITWTHGDGGRYYCETSPSRDTYAGLTFGLLTAFDLVGPDEPVLRAQIRDDLLAMAGYLVRHGWNYVRPNGYVGTHSDEDGFASPLMAHVPLARLNVANAARHVAAVAGSAADRQTWDAVWAEELASQGPILGTAEEVNALQPNQGYFKFNLDHLLGFNLLRTLTGPERELVAGGFAVMDKTTRLDLNAHFEAITYALTGEAARRDAAVTHLMQWLTYQARTGDGQVVRNSARYGTEIRCVPQDQDGVVVEQAPGGSVTYYPGTPEAPPLSHASGLRSDGPLPIAVRPPRDFLWQAPPNALDGQQDPLAREPGIDFLTPYWMLRYFSEAAPPALQPLPAWLGPAHT